MPITKEQREQRRFSLGSSDLAKLMGCDPHGGVYDVWASKVYELADTDSAAMHWGTTLEDPILDWAEGELGSTVTRNVNRQVEGAPIVVNIDGVCDSDGNPVEGKTCGIVSAFAAERDEYGEALSEQVPQRVVIQCHCHMAALPDSTLCYVPTLIGGRGPVMYVVSRCDDLIEVIKEIANDFWARYVTPRREPDDEWTADVSVPRLDILKRIRREPEKVIDFDKAQAKLVTQWEEAKAAFNWSKRMKEQAEAVMVAKLGDAEAANLPNGDQLTYLEQSRAAHEVKASVYSQARRVKKEKVKR